MSGPRVSVVIVYKDWGADRLELVVRSVLNAVSPTDEVIVSDYGSVAGPILGQRLEALGARYIYTHTDGTWSRSAALNAGFSISAGEVLISTDADMLFTPGSLVKVGEHVMSNDNVAVVLQCRDLPEGYSEATIEYDQIDWSTIERASRVRPRWGMGGMMAVRRSVYLALRGFDERMRVYGAEDMDFANRIRRSGVRIHWMENPEIRMYHLWHPPSRTAAVEDDDQRRAVEKNRDIFLNDRTIVRNLPVWQFPLRGEPLVSVVIATRNRADYLGDSIDSVLYQTFEDFEVIIVDDGSADHTREVVASYNDPRVRYIYRPPGGIAAARNSALEITRGKYTVIHDDDDFMLPWRLEASLAAVEEGYQGATGGWVDFDNETAETEFWPGKHYSFATIFHASAVYAHATLLIETQVLRQLRYHESFRSGSDYNLAVRMARSGVRLNHTGRYLLLRRRHAGQVTVTDVANQRATAVATATPLERAVSEDGIRHLRWLGRRAEPAEILEEDAKAQNLELYLPDHLARRIAVISGDLPDSVEGDARLWTVTAEGAIKTRVHYVVNPTWDELARLRQARTPHALRHGTGLDFDKAALWALHDSQGLSKRGVHFMPQGRDLVKGQQRLESRFQLTVEHGGERRAKVGVVEEPTFVAGALGRTDAGRQTLRKVEPISVNREES